MLVLLLLISGCAKPPTLEIDAAKAAIQAAKAAEADVYAASEFGAAQKALADAEAKVTGKEYELAKTAAIQAKEKADAAKSAAGPEKAKAKAGAEEALTQAKAEVAGVMEQIANAPKKADLGTLKSDLEQVEQGISEADAAYNREDYKGAASKAEIIQRNAAGIGESVQIALDAYAAELLKRQSQWYEGARKKKCP
jgi:hypothetical protein